MNEGELCLSVVMPVYNERDAIGQVLDIWSATLQGLGVSYELLVYDDGSTDGTTEVLSAAAGTTPHLRVVRHENVGHGPTILRGYRAARGRWIFQTDSDGETDAGAFTELWTRREQYDFLLATRVGRSAPFTRRAVTNVCRQAVACAFGPGIADVNVPFRLMRASELKRLLTLLPDDTFAPNVILSGLAVRRRLRIFQTPVRHINRRSGRSSLGNFSILRPAARALGQTIAIAWRARDQ
jgi:glycosyltransferase involved in cell wall biosynthesis